MDNYITGRVVKERREKCGLTQKELADRIGVSDKTVSKWETGKGLPDIALLEPLAQALNVSVIELMNGQYVVNKNKAGNMLRSVFSVCPVCGNVIFSTGESVRSCCGITLPVADPEPENAEHTLHCEISDDEYYVTINHEMSKTHYVSFIAYVTYNRCEIVRLYPEQNAEARFFRRGRGRLYAYCNRDGLIVKTI